MSIKSDYAAEEWKSVVAAPYYAGSLIILADINFTYFREVAALGRAITESAAASDSDLIKAVAVDFVSKETQSEIKPELDKLKGEKDPLALKQAMIDYVRGATDLITWTKDLSSPAGYGSPIVSDAPFVWLRLDAAGRPARCFMLDGSSLEWEGRQLHDAARREAKLLSLG